MFKILKKRSFLILLLILAVATFFRLWLLTSVPGGLFPDEAANGLDILLIFQGQHSPFFERGLGREALFFYLQAISVKFLGIGYWQIRLVSVLVGILTVVLTWFFIKKAFNAKIAFLASFFMATSSWHVTLSRTGFRAILVPFFSVLFFYLAYLTFKETLSRKRAVLATLSGAALALGFYTYISFRVMPVIIFFFAILFLLLKTEFFKTHRKEIAIGLISMFLVLAPLIVYFIQHPDSLMGRAGYVSIFNKDQNQGDIVGTFLNVAKKTFWMFFTDGDLNWRHNASGYSMLNPFVSPFFALGFIYSAGIVLFYFIKGNFFKKEELKKYLKYLFLIVWFLAMLAPELLSNESVPHGLRSIGVMPAVFILAALGIVFLFGKIKSLFPQSKRLPVLLNLFLFFLLIGSLIYDYGLYFGVSANSPEFYYAYRSDLSAVSDYLNQRNLKEKTYLVLDPYSVQTPEFLTADYRQPYILVDPAASYKTILKQGDQIVFTQSTVFDAKKFEEYNRETTIVRQQFNRFGEEIMRIYEY